MSAEEDWLAGCFTEEEDLFHEGMMEAAYDEAMEMKIKEIVEENTPRQVNALSPMQLMTQMNETLSKATDFFGKIINIKGIYQQGNGVSYYGYCYDRLKDENSVTQVEILVPATIRTKMKPNSLVIVCGMITKKVEGMKSTVRLLFRVDSIVEEVKAQAVDKDDQRRIELRQRKAEAGFKNVDSILESMLLKGEHPRVALLFAQSSITLEDFESGKRAASLEIDFVEDRVSFTQTSQFCAKLRSLDQQDYTAIALVRGGGIDPKTDVDKTEVIETIVGMNTPIISGVGHKQEIIFLRQVADKCTPTPTGLGQYFSEIVEKTAEKRTNSRDALVKEVEKQFKDQLAAEKKNSENLQKQIEQLTKAHESSYEALKGQLTTEQLLVNQLQEKLNAQGSKIWVYIIIAALSLIAGLVIARLTIAPS